MGKNFKELLTRVKAIVLDVDGVLTDGSVILMPDGDQIRTMNIKDGYAMQLAIKQGLKIAIISGGKSQSIKLRLKGLGIEDIYLGADDKKDALDEFLLTYNFKAEEILYMGDDMPDYDNMKRIGVPTCPADAVAEIKSISIYTSLQKGGKGCVRDVIEQTLKVQGKWK